MTSLQKVVIPLEKWIPAFAGMTLMLFRDFLHWRLKYRPQKYS